MQNQGFCSACPVALTPPSALCFFWSRATKSWESLSALLTVSRSPVSPKRKAAAPSMPGDVNGSDNVDVSDISVIATHIKGIKPIDDSMMKNADVDHDGNISVSDISKVAAHIKGIKALV